MLAMEVVGDAAASRQVLASSLEVLASASMVISQIKTANQEINELAHEVNAVSDIVRLVAAEPELQTDPILTAARSLLVQASDLQDFLVTLRERDRTEGNIQSFLHTFIDGYPRQEKLKEMRKRFGEAKSSLILAIQVTHVGLSRSIVKGDIIVNIITVNRVNDLFCKASGLEDGLRVERLVKSRGRLENDGWHLLDEDIAELGPPPPYIAKVDNSGVSTSAKSPLDAIDQALAPALITVSVSTTWELVRYCKREYPKHRQLNSIMSITGSRTKAFLGSCEEYMGTMWPRYHRIVLRVVGDILNWDGKEDLEYINEEEQLTIRVMSVPVDALPFSKSSRIEFSIIGPREAVGSVTQQIAWLSASLRFPDPGILSESSITVSATRGPETRLRIDQNPLRRLETSVGSHEECWNSLFEGFVIAKDFPIPDRKNSEQGLELPLDIMLAFSGVDYPLDYLKGFVYKGHSSLLAPVRKAGNSVEWHYINRQDKSEFLDMEELHEMWPEATNILEGVSPNDMTAKDIRHFLGCYQLASIHLGTKNSGYDKIRRTPADLAPAVVVRRLFKSEITYTASLAIPHFGNLAVQAKTDIPESAKAKLEEHKTYSDFISDSLKRVVILYNVRSKTGWLVPELNVILHLIQAWGSMQKDEFKLTKSVPLANLGSDEDAPGDAAEDTDVAAGEVAVVDRVVPVHGVAPTNEMNGAVPANAAAHAHAGNVGPLTPAKVFTKNGSDTLRDGISLENRFMWTNNAFKQLRETIMKQYHGYFQPVSIFQFFGGPRTLCGWDFAKLAEFPDSIELLTADIDPRRSGGWETIPKNNKRILTLFCDNLDPPIRPAPHCNHLCPTWAIVPANNYLLVASVPSVMNANTENRGDDECPRLSENHYWTMETDPFRICTCVQANHPAGQQSHQRRCNRFQKLTKSRPRTNFPQQNIRASKGAIVFGEELT